MRLTAGLLIVVSAGVLSQALAADPTPPSPAPSQTAPPPAEQPSATAPTGEQHAVTPAATPKAATPKAATPTSASTEVTHEDLDILSRGYKLEMRHGEKYFCRREGEIGSRFEKKSCYTAASLEAQEVASQEMTRRIQINTPQSGK